MACCLLCKPRPLRRPCVGQGSAAIGTRDTICSQLWESIDHCSNILAYVPNHAQISPEFHKDSLSVQKRCPKSDKSSLQDLLRTRGTPLNRVLCQTSHPELNNNELNSLYVNNHDLSSRYVHEPALSTRVSRGQRTAIAHEVRRGTCSTRCTNG